METVYRLKPGLTWHDGTPFSAEDFALGFRSKQARIAWGQSQPTLEAQLMEGVRADDDRTVVITWRQPYADAAKVEQFDPIPRHIMGAPLEAGSPEAYGGHPYWTTEYVGVGPYRLQRWEPGALIEATAFDGFALGRPKIDRVVLTWSADPNASLSRLLSGDVDMAADSALQFQQAVLLRDWAADRRGNVLLSPTQVRHFNIQLRPEFTTPRAIFDVRVRKAIMHALDRPAIAEAMLEGEGTIAESMIPPTAGFYPLVDRVIPKYPHDLRRAEELMAEAGFTKGADGVYASSSEGRFAPEVRGLAEGQDAQETTIVVDFLRRAGIDAALNLVPTAIYNVNRDEQISTFPAIRTTYATLSGDYAMNKFSSTEIAKLENAWRGSNRTGWVSPAFDRVYEAFSRALDRNERNNLMAEMARLLNESLPVMPMYFNFEVVAHAAGLVGPEVAAPASTAHSKAYQWEWR
jgi:peptide/nickel transport system substrate-binding protein